jgi:hypothetical protein
MSQFGENKMSLLQLMKPVTNRSHRYVQYICMHGHTGRIQDTIKIQCLLKSMHTFISHSSVARSLDHIQIHCQS